jgi:hypothetical protein
MTVATMLFLAGHAAAPTDTRMGGQIGFASAGASACQPEYLENPGQQSAAIAFAAAAEG